MIDLPTVDDKVQERVNEEINNNLIEISETIKNLLGIINDMQLIIDDHETRIAALETP